MTITYALNYSPFSDLNYGYGQFFIGERDHARFAVENGPRSSECIWIVPGTEQDYWRGID